MEYQKVANLLDNTPDQPSKFRTKNWVEINGESKESYGTGSDIRFKTTMLRSNLCDYADAYVLVKGKITITGAGNDDAAKQLDERNKGVIFKNCAASTKCTSRINGTEIDDAQDIDDAAKQLDERNKVVIFKNCAVSTKCTSRINGGTEIDDAQDIDIVMPMYNLIEYSDNYSKTSESLWRYYKDDPNDNITQSESFKSKIRIMGKTPAAGNTKDVEIIVPLEYLSNFWRTVEMPLINFEVNLILTWSSTFVISSATGKTKFKITDTKLCYSCNFINSRLCKIT